MRTLLLFSADVTAVHPQCLLRQQPPLEFSTTTTKVTNHNTGRKNLKPERDSAVINMARYIPDQGAFLVKSPVCHCIRPLHRPCPAVVHPEST